MDKLKHYKLDRAFTDGVEIRLDNATDVAFLVRLPSQYNRAYQQAVYEGIDISTDDNGNVLTGQKILLTRWAQEDAFIRACLVSVDGGPVPANFADEYPAALAELMAKASDLVTDIEERVASSVKGSPGSSTGSDDGPGARSSTSELSEAAG